MSVLADLVARAHRALARLDRAAARVRCPDLLLYRSARREARRRGEPLHEHAPGVPAVDPAELAPMAAIRRGEVWLAGGRPGGWRGLVCDLHWELMQDSDPAAGALRTAASWLEGAGPRTPRRRFPDPSEIKTRLATLGRALGSEQEALLAAASAHARLVQLHPFRDGNGRVAQALVVTVLRARGLIARPCLLIGPTLHARRRAGFAALDRLWSGDEQPWLRFFLAAIEHAAVDSAAACESIHEHFVTDARRLASGGARRLLWRLAEGALPLGAVAQEPARKLRRAGIAAVARGLFGEPILFHRGLARITAGGAAAGRL